MEARKSVDLSLARQGTGNKTAEFVLTYTHCVSSLGEVCTSAGNAAGEITTNTLSATLVAQPGSKDGVGVLVTNASTPGGVLAAYECGGNETTLSGGIMGEILGGTDEAVKETEYHFAPGPGVFQRWGFLGQNVEENFASFKKYFKEEGPPPTAVLFNTVYGPEIPGGELTLPATLQNTWKIKTEAFKIV